jgi:transposase
VQHFQPDWKWKKRYRGGWSGTNRLPAKKADREAWARTVGADGAALLTAIYTNSTNSTNSTNDGENAPSLLRQLPAVAFPRRVWVQNFEQTETGLGFRETDNIAPSSLFISSPHDDEAHLAQKRTSYWVGYKVHLTETCEPNAEEPGQAEAPHLITHVETTAAACADGDVPPRIHQSLKERNLLPSKHLVDTGF